MTKHIGGFLPLEESDGKLYYERLYRYNLARNALGEIVKERKYNLIWLPKYICSCMNDVLRRSGIQIQKYSINENFLPDLLTKRSEEEAILIVNYFSTISPNTVKDLKKLYKNIILDNTQAFYVTPLKGVDTIYSCRKWFGVPDGAFLSTTLSMPKLGQDVSYERSSHIFGKFDCDDDIFYPIYQKEEKQLEKLPAKEMSKLTENLLRAISYRKIAKIRNENFSVLHKYLSKRNRLSNILSQVYKVPFMYPYMPVVECNATVVRNQLRKKKIFLPQLWTDAMDEDTDTRYLCENILYIPIDQRYTTADMIRVIRELELAIKLAS